MGEIADMIVDGQICEICSCDIDGTAPGYPRRCEFCRGSGKPGSSTTRKNRRRRKRRSRNRASSVRDAMGQEQNAREQLVAKGCQLEIKNENQHWIVKGPGVRVEWWPSSRKLVTGDHPNRFNHVRNCENVAGLVKAVEELQARKAKKG